MKAAMNPTVGENEADEQGHWHEADERDAGDEPRPRHGWGGRRTDVSFAVGATHLHDEFRNAGERKANERQPRPEAWPKLAGLRDLVKTSCLEEKRRG
jgi:hypothetical protein